MTPSRPPLAPNPERGGSTLARRGNGPVSGTPPSGIRSGANRGPWESFSANRGPARGSAPATRATAPNALEMRNSARGPALQAIHRAFGRPFEDSHFGNLRSGLNGTVSASSRFGSSLAPRPGGMASAPGTVARNSFSSRLASNRLAFSDLGRFRNLGDFRFHPPFGVFPFRNFGFDFDFDDFFFFRNPFFFNNFFFRNPFFFNNFSPFFFNDFFFRRPFFGCLGCGLGLGGFGFGGGGFGLNFGFGAPFWWGAGWPWYGGLGYPYGPPYGYSLPYAYGPAYNTPGASGPSDNTSAPDTSGRTAKSAENPSAMVVLYLKDGTMFSVRDSWLAEGKLHYTALDGSEDVLDLEVIDFQRTVDENAKRGVPFTLKPNPASSGPK